MRTKLKESPMRAHWEWQQLAAPNWFSRSGFISGCNTKSRATFGHWGRHQHTSAVPHFHRRWWTKIHEGFIHFYKSQMAVSVISLFSAARLFKRRVFNVMFKNSGFKNKGHAKPGLSVSEKWTKSSW